MKKAVLVVVAVAVLGALLIYSAMNEDKTPATSASDQQLETSTYRNGTFRGDSAETLYGPVEIEIVISGGRISDVKYLDMPNDDARSTEITGFSSPALKANTLKAQTANIDFVSGATTTSYGYQQSLQAALDKASGSAVNYKSLQG